MANGSRHSIFLVPEATRGVTPTTPEYEHIRITGTTLGLTKDSLQSEEIRDDRQIADFRLGTNQIAGDINYELSCTTFDKLLEAALMGSWDNNVLKAGTTRRSFSMLRRFSDLETGKKFHSFTGMEVNTLALTVTANAMITGTMGMVGKGLTLLEAAPTGAVFGAPTTTVPLDSFTGQITEGGSTIATVTEVSISLANGLESRFVVGSRESINPSVGRSNVTGNITAFFENTTLLEKFLDETRSSLDFTLPDAAGNSLAVKLPRIVYTGGQPDVSGEGPVTLNMPFQATYDPVTETNIQVTRVVI